MHSFTYRANALLTFSVTILAVMCGLASLSDNFNVPSPTAEIQVDEAAKMLESIRFSQEVVGFHGSMGNMFLSRFCIHGCDGQVSSSKLASLGAYCPNTAAMQHKIGVIQDAGKIIIVLNFNRFKRQPNGNDEVSLTLGISADLQSLFTWNTKQVFVFVAAEYETLQNSLNQVSLWDSIIPSKDHAKFSVQVPNKYRFVDQGAISEVKNSI